MTKSIKSIHINLLATLHLYILLLVSGYFPTLTNSFIFPPNYIARKGTTTSSLVVVARTTSSSVVVASVGKVPTEQEAPVQSDETTKFNDNETSSFFSTILSKENGMNKQKFFEEIWQQKPYLFRSTKDMMSESTTTKTQQQEGWNSLLDMLQYTSFKESSEFIADPPQFLKYSQPLHPQEISTLYQNNLFATFLDGCSSIQNHADLLSPYIAKLCQNIQQEFFPNVYANTYLTPPNSQTFKPHADDRDVFVVQLVGSKNWLVYDNVPIPLPYDHEQVGKYGRDVPPKVLSGPKSIDTTLEIGDILYIPRGHVHEAKCSLDDLSFHVTIAVPTFDWTMAGMMSQATQSILSNNIELRKSMLPLQPPPSISSSSDDVGSSSSGTAAEEQQQREKYIQKQIDIAVDLLKEQVTVDAVMNNLYSKVDRHKQRSTPIRQNQIDQLHVRSNPTINLSTQIRWTGTGVVTVTTGEEQQQQRNPILLRGDVVKPLGSIQKTLEEGLLSSNNKVYRISELRSLMDDNDPNKSMVCDLTLVSWVIQCIRHGHMEIV